MQGRNARLSEKREQVLEPDGFKLGSALEYLCSPNQVTPFPGASSSTPEISQGGEPCTTALMRRAQHTPTYLGLTARILLIE